MKWMFPLVVLSLFANAQVPASKNVWLITEENHSFESVIGSPEMPYFNWLAKQYATSTQYYSPQHSSLTALMWLVARQQVTDNNATTSCFAVNNLVRQLLQAGYSWRSYQEDLPYAGFQGLSSGYYLRRHNPLIDFKEACSGSQVNQSVPYAQLHSDIATGHLSNFAYITPNTQDDAHNGTLSAADSWLARQVPEILSLPAFQPGGDGLLFIVWDEGGLNGDSRCSSRLNAGCGGRVATLVIGPQVRRNYRSSVLYTHTNVLRTICDAMSLAQCPGAAALANPMSDFFNRVQISSPAEWNTTVTSPVHIQATTDNDSKVYALQVYVDDVLAKQVSGAPIDTSLTLGSGAHHIVVQSWDRNGGIHKTSRKVVVGATSLQVLSPMPNATVGSSVSVQALGSSNFREIALSVDGILNSQRSGNLLATTLSLKAGPHRLTFSGTLTNGGTTSREILVNSASKAVTIARPGVSASLPSPVEVRGFASDSVPVVDSQIYVDNVLRYETNGYGVDFPLNLSGGKHNITVQAWNAQGQTYKSSVSMSVLPIQIDVSSPLAGSVHSPVAVSAAAQSTRVVAMQLYVDDALQFQSSGSTLQTSVGLSVGPHRLVVQAWDENGGVWKKEVDVNSN
jgi:acid phosphatase